MFYKEYTHPVFYVASRGHHADIGGITPGWYVKTHSADNHFEQLCDAVYDQALNLCDKLVSIHRNRTYRMERSQGDSPTQIWFPLSH